MSTTFDDVELVEVYFELDRDGGECASRFVFDTSAADVDAAEFGDIMVEQMQQSEQANIDSTGTANVGEDGDSVTVWKSLSNKGIEPDDFDLGALMSYVVTPMKWWFGDKPKYAGTLADEVHDAAVSIERGAYYGQ